MVGRHCLCASSQLVELLRSRQLVKVLEYTVVELVDDDAGSVRRYQICRGCPSQCDGWSSAGCGLEQNQAERIAACWYQQKMYGSVHRHEIVAVLVADKLGARSREACSLWSIANNHQPTAETLHRVGTTHDSGEIFLLCDSANEPEYNPMRVLNARACRVGGRKPPNI